MVKRRAHNKTKIDLAELEKLMSGSDRCQDAVDKIGAKLFEMKGHKYFQKRHRSLVSAAMQNITTRGLPASSKKLKRQQLKYALFIIYTLHMAIYFIVSASGKYFTSTAYSLRQNTYKHASVILSIIFVW